MKHIRTFESYRSLRNKENEQLEPVNEEIFGAIGKFFSNLFKNIKQKIFKVKGGKEVEEIYNKYLQKIQEEIKKAAGVELNLSASADSKAREEQKAKSEKEKAAAAPAAKTETYSERFKRSQRIFEADEEVDTKLDAEKLKAKANIIKEILNKLKTMALKEMDAVLKKFGGASENPKLEIIITAKKDEFELAFLNAQVEFLEKAGDKTQVAEMAKKRDAITKKIQKQYEDMDKAQQITYETGDEVIYLKKDKKKEDYDPKKKPEEQKEVVGVGSLVSKDGDKIKIEDEDGKDIDLTSDSLVGKTEGSKPVEFKEGDLVVFKRDGFKENDGKKKWSELKDEDKQNAESEGLKKMIDDELVNIKKVERIDGDFFVFKGKDDKEFKKKKTEVLGVTKAKEGEAQGEKKEGEAQGEKKEGEAQGEKKEGDAQKPAQGQAQKPAQAQEEKK